ncbi:MAG: DNA gyrase subunit A [Candidatus Pacearchaeota archaeon]|jgi:hypothetical protein|nr:hypothetical protein [Clostridia bacterium]
MARRTKIIRLPISSQIDINYRNYALYVLEKRGIPSWYDGLTNVQRLILLNSGTTFGKTLTVAGSCISDGYHHGDASLSGAINKLARPFGCSESILIGDGFFGSPIKTDAAAARYTSVKLNPKFAKIIKENAVLNSRDEEGGWNSLWLQYPIGLVTNIIGIAVGYKTTILPRKLEDIQNYYDGKIKEVMPYFANFTGNVERFQGMDKTYIISGDVIANDVKKEILIKDIPPLIKFSSFSEKIDKIIELHNGKCKVDNNSKTNVNLKLVYTGYAQDWPTFKSAIIKATKILVTETAVFVKDNIVIQYDKIEDYLDDFKYRQAQLNLERSKYNLEQTDMELAFNKAKKLYLEFMLVKKRTEAEIDTFLEQFDKRISNRLNSTLLRHLSADELQRTVAKIKEIEKELKETQKETEKLQKIFAKMKDVALTRGVKNKAAKDLFDEVEMIDGIEVFKGESDDEDDDNAPFNPADYI